MFRLAKLSLGNRALIALITVFASVFGVITMSSLKQELIPSIEFPQITVITSMPGASPEVVDKQVRPAAGNGAERRRGPGVDVVHLPQRRLADQPGVHLRLQPGPGPEPDRPGHLQRQAPLPDDVQPQAIAGSISDFPIVFLAVSSDKPLSELNADLAAADASRGCKSSTASAAPT